MGKFGRNGIRIKSVFYVGRDPCRVKGNYYIVVVV